MMRLRVLISHIKLGLFGAHAGATARAQFTIHSITGIVRRPFILSQRRT